MKNNVRQYRKEKHITQEELAKTLHVSRQTINAIENEKYAPTLELALKLSLYLDISVNELFTLEEVQGYEKAKQ